MKDSSLRLSTGIAFGSTSSVHFTLTNRLTPCVEAGSRSILGHVLGHATYLADVDLIEMALRGNPLVVPYDQGDVQPASIDLRLSGEQFHYTFTDYRLGDDILDEQIANEPFETLLLAPQQTAHLGLVGKIVVPDDCVGFVFARSSITRLSLRIAPVFMNPGYSGYLPIAMTNAGSSAVTIVKGVRVAQLVCARMEKTSRRSYADAEGKYHEENVEPSRLHSDNDIKAALTKALQSYFPDELVNTVV